MTPRAPVSSSGPEPVGGGAPLAGLLPKMLEALADAILIVDREQTVVFANRRYLEAFGARGPAPCRPCHDAVRCPEHGAPGPCPACRARDDRRVLHEMRSIPDRHGAMHRWDATFSPLMNDSGEVTHIIEVWRDISDRTALEGQLAHNERLASVGMLAAGVGHEINNPLASILAAVESLTRMLDRGGDPARFRAEALETLQMIDDDVVRCRETTDKLMLLAQPYSGAFAWVDVNRAIRDTAALLRHQMVRQGVAWREALDPALPPVWARDSGVRGICMNLMLNAVQAMPDGGELLVRTAAHEDGVEMTVEDSGAGLLPENMNRIWEPFFTTKPAGQGTGLGLFVTQSVVARYGGSIHAANREAGGARFLVRLPVNGEKTP